MDPSFTTTIRPIDAFGAGVYTLTMMSHATLWWSRRGRATHFWLALSALGALLVDLSWIAIVQGTDSPGKALTALNMLGIVIALTSLYELTEAIGGRRVGRVARWMEGLLLGLIVLHLITSQSVMVPLLMAVSVLFLLAAMQRAVRNIRSGDRESRVLALGLVVLLATLIYDLLTELQLLPRVYGTPVVGFTVLYLLATRALSLRYEREYRELVTLRGELESRVQRRTLELAEANVRLDALSRTDVLTGLANRRAFSEEAGKRGGQPYAVLMIDIDHFKAINDTHGHAAGDAALRSVADALNGALREHDLLARWGGEEFIAMIDVEGARAVADRVREAVAATPFRFGDASPPLRVSIGLAVATPDEALEAVAAKADRALYEAKRSGRDRVVEFSALDIGTMSA